MNDSRPGERGGRWPLTDLDMDRLLGAVQLALDEAVYRVVDADLTAEVVDFAVNHWRPWGLVPLDQHVWRSILNRFSERHHYMLRSGRGSLLAFAMHDQQRRDFFEHRTDDELQWVAALVIGRWVHP